MRSDAAQIIALSQTQMNESGEPNLMSVATPLEGSVVTSLNGSLVTSLVSDVASPQLTPSHSANNGHPAVVVYKERTAL